ncbi:MAG: FAD-dependent oxidoreductase, partial [Candidatus Hydrogenedens sp.]|nr:FAD-dependent oxidoreductase [Candidatus Hydrogenedens sp.]
MRLVEEKLSTPVVDSADVLVVGGGIAGVAAAVAARRQGTDVMILEKTALFGGLATNGLISWYEPLCDGQGIQLMHGLPEELLRLSIQYGPDTLPEIWHDRSVPVDKSKVSPKKQNRIGGRYATYYSPTTFQLAIDELLIKEGVRIQLCTSVVRPVMEGNRCTGVITESISGRQAFTAQMVIDATGDAIILSRAGVPCVDGQNYFSFVAHEMDTASTENILSRRRWHSIGANLYGGGHPKDLPLVSGTTAKEETDFLLRGRRCLLEEIRGRDRIKNDITALPH